MGLGTTAAPPDIAMEVANIGGLEIAPAAFVQPGSCDISRSVAALNPVLQLPLIV